MTTREVQINHYNATRDAWQAAQQAAQQSLNDARHTMEAADNPNMPTRKRWESFGWQVVSVERVM